MALVFPAGGVAKPWLAGVVFAEEAEARDVLDAREAGKAVQRRQDWRLPD
jgi:hypothetical protein